MFNPKRRTQSVQYDKGRGIGRTTLSTNGRDPAPPHLNLEIQTRHLKYRKHHYVLMHAASSSGDRPTYQSKVLPHTSTLSGVRRPRRVMVLHTPETVHGKAEALGTADCFRRRPVCVVASAASRPRVATFGTT